MRSRLKNPKFLGPKLPHGQRACRKYEKAHGAGAFSRAPQGDHDMVSISGSGRYLPPSKSLLKAMELQGGDLVVQIDYVEFDHALGDSGKYVDLVHFTNDEHVLSLNSTNAHAIAALHGDDTDNWPGGWIALFHDPAVKFEDKAMGGIRVRPFIPNSEQGASPTKEPRSVKSAPKPLGDGKQEAGREFDDPFRFEGCCRG